MAPYPEPAADSGPVHLSVSFRIIMENNNIAELVNKILKPSKWAYYLYPIFMGFFIFGIWHNYVKALRVIEISGDFKFPANASNGYVMITTLQFSIPIIVSFSLINLQMIVIFLMTMKLIEHKYGNRDENKLLLELAERIKKLEENN